MSQIGGACSHCGADGVNVKTCGLLGVKNPNPKHNSTPKIKKPVSPVKADIPVKPVSPVKADIPVKPVSPVKPVTLVKADSPVKPVSPVKAVNPVKRIRLGKRKVVKGPTPVKAPTPVKGPTPVKAPTPVKTATDDESHADESAAEHKKHKKDKKDKKHKDKKDKKDKTTEASLKLKPSKLSFTDLDLDLKLDIAAPTIDLKKVKTPQISTIRRPRKVFKDITPELIPEKEIKPIDYFTAVTPFIRLEELNMTHYKDLLPIVNKKEIMANIAAGEIWSDKKLEEKIRDAQDEWLRDARVRGYFWGILYNSYCIGIVGFFPPRKQEKLSLRIFLNDRYQGRGVGKIAIKLAIDNMIRLRPDLEELHGSAHAENYTSQNLMLSCGFKYVNNSKIKSIEVSNFIFKLTSQSKKLDDDLIFRLNPYSSDFERQFTHYNTLWKDINYDALEATVAGMKPGMRIKIEAQHDWMLTDVDQILAKRFQKVNVTGKTQIWVKLATPFPVFKQETPPKKISAKVQLKEVIPKKISLSKPDVVLKEEDDFPYRKSYLPSFQEMARKLIEEKKVRQDFGFSRDLSKKFTTSPWDIDTREDHLAIVTREFPDESLFIDSLTDIVVEPIRIRCNELKQTSPLDAWQTIRNTKLVKSLKTPHEKREAVYEKARGCNLFNVSLGIYLLTGNGTGVWDPWVDGKPSSMRDITGPGDILDPAAGWGDRLGAAFISNAKSYDGWDTNAALQPVYNKLAQEYSKLKLKLDWKITAEPFENADLKGKKYDTVLTSPPFFNVEEYEGEETSTVKYKTKGEWIKGYYAPMLTKAADALKPGGRFIAYISNGWMFEEARRILNRSNLTYIGAVGFQQVDKKSKKESFIRNAYIWRLQEGLPKDFKAMVFPDWVKDSIARKKIKYNAVPLVYDTEVQIKAITPAQIDYKDIFPQKKGVDFSKLKIAQADLPFVTSNKDVKKILKFMQDSLMNPLDKEDVVLLNPDGALTIHFALEFLSTDARSVSLSENFNSIYDNIELFKLDRASTHRYASVVDTSNGSSDHIPSDYSVIYIDITKGPKRDLDLKQALKILIEKTHNVRFHRTLSRDQMFFKTRKAPAVFIKVPNNYNFKELDGLKIFHSNVLKLDGFSIVYLNISMSDTDSPTLNIPVKTDFIEKKAARKMFFTSDKVDYSKLYLTKDIVNFKRKDMKKTLEFMTHVLETETLQDKKIKVIKGDVASVIHFAVNFSSVYDMETLFTDDRDHDTARMNNIAQFKLENVYNASIDDESVYQLGSDADVVYIDMSRTNEEDLVLDSKPIHKYLKDYIKFMEGVERPAKIKTGPPKPQYIFLKVLQSYNNFKKLDKLRVRQRHTLPLGEFTIVCFEITSTLNTFTVV